MVTFIKSLPQPVKALYVLALSVFAVGFVLMLIGNLTGNTNGAASLWISAFAGTFVLIGICFVTDFNASARKAAAAAGKYRPLGSKAAPFQPTVGLIRLFGAFFVVVGSAFVFLIVTRGL